jgi:hypothetical protein
MNKCCTREEALTGFGILILGINMVLNIALMFRLPVTGTGNDFCRHSWAIPGNILRSVGLVTAFSAVNGTPHDVDARSPEPDPGRMESVELNVALFIGSMGGVDLTRSAFSGSATALTRLSPGLTAARLSARAG